MTTPTFGGAPSASRPHHAPENHWLDMRQEPEKARVVVRGKEKDRKPVDPPPIVQLKVQDPYNDTCSYLHNPYYFCSCTLWDAEQDIPKRPDPSPGAPPPETLQGQLVSSLHRLKDFDNTEQGFFVFSDVSVGLMGKFRLRFSVYEYRPSGDCIFLKSKLSQVFEVVAPKDWDGVRESTALSRSFADQGVRIRLRKESRHSSKRAYNSQQAGPAIAPQTPLRPHPQQAGSYASSSSQDGAAAAAAAAQGEPAFKRQRSYPTPAAAQGYMTSTSQAWQQPIYAPVPAQGQMPYGGQHHPNYYGTPYGQYPPPPQQQQQQQQPASQSSSFVSGYPSPSAQSSSQQQYQTPTSRGYVQAQSAYVTAPSGMYNNTQQQYANLPAKYPAQSNAYNSQHQSPAQGSMAGYGTPQSQQAPFQASSAYGGAPQSHTPTQQQQRGAYPLPNQAPSHPQYNISHSASVAYRPGPPSGSGQTQAHEDSDTRHMANPQNTPRLNPIHGSGAHGREMPLQSTEADQQHTPTPMQHPALQQRRQPHFPPGSTHGPSGPSEG